MESLLQEITHARDLRHVTDWIATKVLVLARAIAFLHQHETLHFDIKPANILFDTGDKPLLSDLGFAKKRTLSPDGTVVGFTLFYAHPFLRREYQHMSSQNRVRRALAPSQFQYTWDLYAFGRTLLQILSIIDQKFPDAVMYDYTFVYLHLVACRMLDGQNLSKEESQRIRAEQLRKKDGLSVYLEHWLTLKPEDFEQLHYTCVEDVCRDLSKLAEPERHLASIPELSPFFPNRVQISAGAPAPFSRRLKAIIEHPTFFRLRYVRHLGVADAVYPGCSHSRFEHSLGVFRMCWLYLQALYHDAYNPLFKQLTDEKDLKCVLLASLLHDLGQYSLAHDIEETVPNSILSEGRRWKDCLKHENLTFRWLDNPTTNADGLTLSDIIQNKEWGWGVSVEDVKGVLKPDLEPEQGSLLPPNLKTGMLHSIIDGPLDVDKLDYLVRDSEHAQLTYGKSIDTDRLVRNLTIVLTEDENKHTVLTLGSYEKGLPAAESVTFARYALYQALYWHHAVRAIRPMLRQVFRECEKVRKRDGGKKKKPFNQAFDDMLGINKEPRSVGIREMLKLIASYSSEEGKELINMITARRFYKRLLTVHSHREEEGKPSTLEHFRNCHLQPSFDESLQKEIRDRLEAFVNSAAGPQPSVLGKDACANVLSKLDVPGRVLCDCPTASVGSVQKLRFALEPKRLLQNYASRVEAGERVSEVWQQVYFKLMDIASKGRIYCHPDVRDAIMAALGPDGLREALKKVIAKHLT